MTYQTDALFYIRIISALIALTLIGLLWTKRKAPGAIFLILFEVTAVIWAIGDGFEGAATSLDKKLLWSQFSYIGITTGGLMFLLFALSYTNTFPRLRFRTFIPLALIIPLITLLIAFTNSHHHLLWSDVIIAENSNQSIYYYGPWVWIHVAYEYLMLTVGIIILLTGSVKAYSLHRLQTGLLILASVLPLIASILYVFKLLPVKGVDLTPITFIITGIIIAFSLFWLRMFNVIPLARRQAIQNLRDGLFVIDSANLIVEANQTLCEITGFSINEIIGKNAQSVFSVLKISCDQFTPANNHTIEIAVGKEPDVMEYEVKCQMVTDTEGNTAARIFELNDITLKKMIISELADSNTRLKNEVIEKEKLILDLNAYTRSVAHDMKNPVGTMVSLSELIRMYLEKQKNEEALEMAAMLEEQGRDLIRTIDGLLLLSRIRKEDVILNRVDIAQTVSSVLRRLNEEVVERKAVVDLPASWPLVMGNTEWIEELWANLISNGLKYGGSPPVISLGYEPLSDNRYSLWVKDNGNGIPSEYVKKIFNDFERLGRTDIRGQGLGLSIVKRIIEKMGGEILVESQALPGEGSKFSFILKGYDAMDPDLSGELLI